MEPEPGAGAGSRFRSRQQAPEPEPVKIGPAPQHCLQLRNDFFFQAAPSIVLATRVLHWLPHTLKYQTKPWNHKQIKILIQCSSQFEFIQLKCDGKRQPCLASSYYPSPTTLPALTSRILIASLQILSFVMISTGTGTANPAPVRIRWVSRILFSSVRKLNKKSF